MHCEGACDRMGDSEKNIEYTPDELAEIEEVFNAISAIEMPRRKSAQAVLEASPSAGEGIESLDEISEPGSEEEAPPEEEIVDITADIEEIPEDEGTVRLEASDLSAEELPAEIGEVPEIDTGEPAVLPESAKADELLEEVTGFEETPEKMPPSRPPREPKTEEATTLDELEALTADETPAGSEQLSGEVSIGGEGMPEVEVAHELSLEGTSVEDVPDFSDMSIQKTEAIQTASDEEIPAIDLESIPDTGAETVSAPHVDDLGADDIDIDTFREAPPKPKVSEKPAPARQAAQTVEIEDIDMGPSIRGMDEISEVADTMEAPAVEEEEEKPKRKVREAPAPEKDELDLSDRELKKLKTAVSLYHPNLRKAVIQSIVDDLISPKDQRQLVDMIIGSKPEDNIRRFLEKKLGRTIDISSIAAEAGRKVLTSRAEYTHEGMERQKQLLKYTKIFGAAALVTCVIVVLLFQFVYKPAMAKRKIREGVALIREPGIPPYQRVKNFEAAERIFKIVDQDYVENYIPGYNAYARAYFDVKEYAFSYQKLKKAFELKPGNIETLNNLGYYYSRVPEKYYQDNYRTIIPPDKKEPDTASRLDVAIRFYNYALLREPDNVTALYGIGNTYMFQERYFEARKYYEDILKGDRDSVVGNSGLLNLFIERDDFPETVTLHARLKDRDILENLDPALLAKLAWYYLSKKTTAKLNVRVDYGLKSSRFTDLADNPYPAVRDILSVLADRHPEYPPLYLHKALFARDTGNYKLMREYLEIAVKKEPNYYGAHHLLGEYHLIVKEPADAYRELKTALKTYQSPPEFTFNDFYKETEALGRTYALLGNVFYYYYDKVRSRFRYADELEEVVIDSELEKKANDGIAQEYYEKAITEGDKSSEVFYNLGRLFYIRGLYNKALEMWLNLYDDFIAKPELMLALGNAFYRMNNFESGKGEYLRLISVLENVIEDVPVPSISKIEDVKLYRSLSSAYNNLGVIYQLQGNEVKANLCYWRSIDFAKRIDRENEYARVNMTRSFKERKEEIVPLLDDDIPFSLNVYRADMR